MREMVSVFEHLKSQHTLRDIKRQYQDRWVVSIRAKDIFVYLVKRKRFKYLNHAKDETRDSPVLFNDHFQTGHVLWGDTAETMQASEGRMWSEWPVRGIFQ